MHSETRTWHGNIQLKLSRFAQILLEFVGKNMVRDVPLNKVVTVNECTALSHPEGPWSV